MNKKKSFRREFWRTAHLFVENAVTNNIVLIQALGLCPIIGAGTTLQNGVALAACTAAVMIPPVNSKNSTATSAEPRSEFFRLIIITHLRRRWRDDRF